MGQHKFGRMTASAVLALGVAGVGSVATADHASAATACSGTKTFVFTAKGKAQLVIYYNSSNGGTNSACMYHLGSYYGKAERTTVQIGRCTTWSGPEGKSCTLDKLSKVDANKYKYYAGPRGVTGTAKRCVWAKGTMHLTNGKTLVLVSGRQGCK